MRGEETLVLTPPKKAVALLSGGLDSLLAAKLVKDWGIEVVGLHLLSPFQCRSDVVRVAESIGIPLLFREKGERYLDLVEKPRFGYGKNINPCVDCRVFMFQMADEVMAEIGASFLVTGEVVGQRPKSQVRANMNLIDKHSPLGDRILRPLSGAYFPATLPEKQGWIKRESLLKITGRSRKHQLQLAKNLGLKDHPSPAGGCLLTDALFAKKLRDFFAHSQTASSEERRVMSEVLRIGRHFRLSPDVKAILARTEKESRELEVLSTKTPVTIFRPEGFQGPVALAVGPLDEKTRGEVGALVLRFSRDRRPGQISFESQTERGQIEARLPFPEERLREVYL